MDNNNKLKAMMLLVVFRRKSVVFVEESEDEVDEDEETILQLLAEEYDLRLRGSHPHKERIKDYVERVVPFYNAANFRSHFRMASTTANRLENLLSPILARQGPVGRFAIEPRQQLLSILWLLATPDSYRSVGEQFGMSKSTLHQCFRRVIYALTGIAKDYIVWPQGLEAEHVKTRFQSLAGMPNVIGAIDGCQIEIDAPKERAEAYRTSKKHYAIQLQAVTTADLLFTDVFAGYPGAVHDARVLRNSPLCRDWREIFIGDEYLVGDKGYYPVKTWCIPPYKNSGNLTPAETAFNIKLGKTRQVVERAFALFKGRMRRMKHLPMLRTDEIPVAILAACVIHNICLTGMEESRDELNDYIHEGQAAEQDTIVDEEETPSFGNEEAINKRNRIKDLLF